LQNKSHLDLVLNDDPKAIDLMVKNRMVYYALKRLMDFVISLALLVILSPLMLLIALGILLYSPGPVFFVQERVGSKRQFKGQYLKWKKVTFSCYKFRTMHINTDSSIHQEFVQALIENDQEKMKALQGEETGVRKLINDPRITRPGKLLRKLSLDELPQLWNVIRGDMSLVGPRPAIPYEIKMYKPWHLGRLQAQPGITGLQQVTARSAADFDEQTRLDIEYIKKQSLWLDLQIALRTPFVVISTRGAH
jgi:lipopolysaccharide/colanic/teichoic acid biosynthesis glycosyltransferase